MGQAKRTPTNHTKGQSSSKEGDGVVFMVGLEGSPLLWLSLENQIINSNQYCSQWAQLKAATRWKSPGITQKKMYNLPSGYHQIHISLMTRQKLLQLGWKVLIHLLYSPDIAPLDFHLFQSLQYYFNGKNFNSLKDCKRHLEQFFAQKDKKFWEDRIMKLPEKMAEGSGTKQWRHCSVKFLVKNMSLIFT